MAQDHADLSQDVVFDILSSPRRRYVLYYLRNQDAPIKLTDLAEHVAAWENDTDTDSITEQERKRVYVSLYQTHIPRLDEAGVVEYDQDSGRVALAEEGKQIDHFLASREQQISWQVVYIGLGIVGVVLLGLTALDVALFSTISEAVVASTVILSYVFVAVVHSLYRAITGNTVPDELQR